mgnify:CR=1 FL=1
MLKPSNEDQGKMDHLYSQIRETPPPDICEFLMDNAELYRAIRGNEFKLGKEQIEKIRLIIGGKI